MEPDDIAHNPELMPPPPPPPPPSHKRRALIGRRGATAAVAGGLMVGGLAGGYVISQAATPSPSASATPSNGATAAPDTDHGAATGAGPASRTEDLSQVAGAIGITATQLQTEVATGKTIAAVAKAHNADLAKVISTLAGAENAEIDAAASTGKITAAQATAMKANTTLRVTDWVNGVRPAGGHRGRDGVRGEDQTVVAGAIGITVQMLQTELSGGKTIAAVAGAHNVAASKVISALADSENKEIDAALASGRLTAAQATQAKTQTTQRATNEVNDIEGPGEHGGPAPAPGTSPTN